MENEETAEMKAGKAKRTIYWAMAFFILLSFGMAWAAGALRID